MDFGLDRIKGFSATTMLSVVGGTILPGFLFLFIYDRDMFVTIDKFLLCLIAPTITLPILILNSGLILLNIMKGDPDSPPDDETFHKIFAGALYFGNLITSIVIYSVILSGYFFALKLKTGVLITFILQAVISLIMLTLLLITGDKKKK